MNVYVDTGILAKLYTHESNSPQAIQLVSQFNPPFPLTHFQELELRTALRLKFFRQEMDAADLRWSLGNLSRDIHEERWQRPQYELARVHDGAEALSEQHAALIGCRTLDILHVAAAKVLGVSDFLTYDTRQAELARLAGLKIWP